MLLILDKKNNFWKFQRLEYYFFVNLDEQKLIFPEHKSVANLRAYSWKLLNYRKKNCILFTYAVYITIYIPPAK